MASTTTHPNNAAVKFRGHAEREMAATDKPMTGKLPKTGGVKKLSRRARKLGRKLAKGGMISETAMKKHMGDGY